MNTDKNSVCCNGDCNQGRTCPVRLGSYKTAGAVHETNEPISDLESTHLRKLAAYRTTVENLKAELVQEAARTAEEKLRADHMSQQHDTQAALNREAREQLAAFNSAPAAYLTDAQIDSAFDRMPDGAQGFLKSWGYRQFAREIEAMRYVPAPKSTNPVGEAGAMPGTAGFTMACFHADKVPLGTKLYAHSAPQAQDVQRDADIQRAVLAERERICAAIKAEDDHCVTQGDYMLDSEDCIKVVRGEWVRPVYEIGSAAQKGGEA